MFIRSLNQICKLALMASIKSEKINKHCITYSWSVWIGNWSGTFCGSLVLTVAGWQKQREGNKTHTIKTYKKMTNWVSNGITWTWTRVRSSHKHKDTAKYAQPISKDTSRYVQLANTRMYPKNVQQGSKVQTEHPPHTGFWNRLIIKLHWGWWGQENNVKRIANSQNKCSSLLLSSKTPWRNQLFPKTNSLLFGWYCCIPDALWPLDETSDLGP